MRRLTIKTQAILIATVLTLVIALTFGILGALALYYTQSRAFKVAFREKSNYQTLIKQSKLENLLNVAELLSQQQQFLIFFKELGTSLSKVREELDISNEAMLDIQDTLRKYYFANYKEQYLKWQKQLSAKVDYLIILNYLYLVLNPQPVAKRYLFNFAGDNSGYSKVHLKLQPFIQKISEKYTFSDLFFINTAGEIFYSLQKRLDFGVDLQDNRFKDTTLATLFYNSLQGRSIQFTFTDTDNFFSNDQEILILTPLNEGEKLLGFCGIKVPLIYLNKTSKNYGEINKFKSFLINNFTDVSHKTIFKNIYKQLLFYFFIISILAILIGSCVYVFYKKHITKILSYICEHVNFCRSGKEADLLKVRDYLDETINFISATLKSFPVLLNDTKDLTAKTNNLISKYMEVISSLDKDMETYKIIQKDLPKAVLIINHLQHVLKNSHSAIEQLLEINSEEAATVFLDNNQKILPHLTAVSTKLKEEFASLSKLKFGYESTLYHIQEFSSSIQTKTKIDPKIKQVLTTELDSIANNIVYWLEELSRLHNALSEILELDFSFMDELVKVGAENEKLAKHKKQRQIFQQQILLKVKDLIIQEGRNFTKYEKQMTLIEDELAKLLASKTMVKQEYSAAQASFTKIISILNL